MLVFVDESGDSGMKGKEGSSKFFTITAVLFRDRKQAESCDCRIDAIRQELQLPPRYEFHFNSCSAEIRKHFLMGVRDFDFSFSSLVLHKEKVTGEGFRKSGESLYKYCSSLLFSNVEDQLDHAIVIFDKSGSYAFRKGLDRYLKERISSSGDRQVIRKVKSQRSDGNNLIQLADMVCGAVARSFRTDRKDRTAFRNIIEAKKIRVQVWPSQKKESPPPIP